MLVFKRFAHNCVGCGSKLVLPLSRSTAKFNGEVPSVRGQADDKINELAAAFSPEQVSALRGSNDLENAISKRDLRDQLRAKRQMAAKRSQVCKPCVMAREGSITSIQRPEPRPREQLGRLFHVVDAMSFPLGLPDLQLAPAGDVFIINRCDLLVSHESQLPKLKRYFMQTTFAKHGVSADRVVLTSASRKWHLKKLSELFVTKPKRNYFVGPTNAGKTRLVHELSNVQHTGAATTWPLPFATQHPLEYKSAWEYRAKTLVDCPSDAHGSAALLELLSSVIRKTCAGTRMTLRDPKYKLPVVKAKTGQVVSIGGLFAIELPRVDAERQIPVHVFVGIGGISHSEYARAMSSVAKLHEINASMNEAHLKMRIHDHVGLQLKPVFKFSLASSTGRPQIVIKSIGYLQPFVFGDLPRDYEATVWAPADTDVGLREEVLPFV